MKSQQTRLIHLALPSFAFSALFGLGSFSVHAEMCVSGKPYNSPAYKSCVVPPNIKFMDVVVIGAGGGGGKPIDGPAGPGGHGAKLKIRNYPVVPGTTLKMQIGSGGESHLSGGGGGSTNLNAGYANQIIAGGGGGAPGGARASGAGGSAGSFGSVIGAGAMGTGQMAFPPQPKGGAGGAQGRGGVSGGGHGAGNGANSTHGGPGGPGGGQKGSKPNGGGQGGAGGYGGGSGRGGQGGARGVYLKSDAFGGGGGGGFGGGGGGFGGVYEATGGGGGGSVGPAGTIYETASNGGPVNTRGGHGSILLTFELKAPVLYGPNQTGTVGQHFSYTPGNTGGPIDTCTAAYLPPGLALNTKTCELSGRPTQADVYTTVVTATNATGSARVPIIITINPIAPLLSGVAPTGQWGSAYSFLPRNAGGPIASCTAKGLPSGLIVDANTCALSGTPTQDGNFTTTITAKNVTGADALRVSIKIDTKRPLLSGTAPAGSVGKPYRFTPRNSGGAIRSCTHNGLPTGLTVDTTNCSVTGQPSRAGRYSFSVTAKNAKGSDTLTADIAIRPAAPALSGTASAGQVGKAYRFIPSNAGGALETCTATALPEGLAIDSSTCARSGTPTQEGQYHSKIIARNAGGSYTLSTAISIAAADQTGPVGPSDPTDPTNPEDPTSIPTLSEWGMILLCSVIILFGFRFVHRSKSAYWQ
jgi:hypothetical protein